jgi:hypothetical protein
MPGPFDSFSGAVGQASSTIGSIGTQAMGTLGTIAGTAGRISGAINSAQGAVASVSALRSISLPPGGNPVAKFAAGAALFNGAIGQAAGALGAIASIFGGGGGSGDWRARLTCPLGELVFPYTPTIQIQGGATYDEQPITHQNYSFFSYQNSKAESISISAPFYVEDAMQADVWIKAVNFLRATTKMFSDGNPPIILKFNAYGNYVFKDIPVIIKSYSVDLPSGVDYISTGSSHVPIKSNFSVSLQPIYSREKIKTFNLQSFINGGSAGFV